MAGFAIRRPTRCQMVHNSPSSGLASVACRIMAFSISEGRPVVRCRRLVRFRSAGTRQLRLLWLLRHPYQFAHFRFSARRHNSHYCHPLARLANRYLPCCMVGDDINSVLCVPRLPLGLHRQTLRTDLRRCCRHTLYSYSRHVPWEFRYFPATPTGSDRGTRSLRERHHSKRYRCAC